MASVPAHEQRPSNSSSAPKQVSFAFSSASTLTWSDTNKLLFHVAPPGKFTFVCQKHGSVSGLHWDLPNQDSDPCSVTLGVLLQTLLPAVAVGIILFYCLSVW